MKKGKIIRAALSSVLLAGILLTGCAKDNGDTEETTVSSVSETDGMIKIAENGSSEYEIIFPENTDSKLREEIMALKEAIYEATGARIEVRDDYIKAGKSEVGEYEILVGSTNRDESAEVCEGLGYRDYTVCVKGKKVVIAGGSSAATIAALVHARSLVGGESFSLSESYGYSVKNADISEYYYVLYPVSSGMTAKESSIAINNASDTVPQKLASESVQLTEFDSSWGYTHHSRIGRFKGRVYAAWTATPKDEDTVDSKIMISSSSDFENWSEPFAIVKNDPLVECSSGFFHTYGDKLYFYYNTVTYKSNLTDVEVSGAYYVSTSDGESWSEPKEFGLYTGSTAPQFSYGGRLFLCRGTSVLYTDDPSGESGWIRRDIDASAVEDAYAAGARELCEGNFYQSFDGVIHMIMRADDGYLWQTESYDNGESWSKIYKTSFTDDNAMSYFGKLPDGRIYYIGNPYYTGYSLRSPLMLCISEDGYSFGEQYVLKDEADYSMEQYGLAKSGYYGYPEAVAGDDGYVYVIYSKLKEVIEVTRFKISDLESSEAKTEIDFTDKGIRYSFDSEGACGAVSPQGSTVAEYDSKEKALKVSGASSITLQEISDSFLSGSTSAEDMPVLAVRIKKVNYTGKYCGLLYWKTDAQSSFYKFGSFRYANDEEYHTMILDLSELYCYASSSSQTESVSAFRGDWNALKMTLGNSADMNKNTAFYIKWIAVYPSVSDAMRAYMGQ